MTLGVTGVAGRLGRLVAEQLLEKLPPQELDDGALTALVEQSASA